jgi:hypothetical protein
MGHPNEALLRRGYEAFATGDVATVMSIFDEDIVWHSPGRGQLSGDFKGHQQVTEFFVKIFELSGGTFKNEIHDILADDEHGMVLVHTTAQRAGKSFDALRPPSSGTSRWTPTRPTSSGADTARDPAPVCDAGPAQTTSTGEARNVSTSCVFGWSHSGLKAREWPRLRGEPCR